MQLTLGKGEDPALYEEAVIGFEVLYDTEFTEEDKISTALVALGVEHGETMYNAIQRIEDKGEEVTFADLMKAVKAKWRATGSGYDQMPDAPTETALVASVRTANDGVTCYYCGENGHVRRDCPIMKQAREVMQTVKCGYPGCGKMGHTTETCWNSSPKNAKYCPKRFKLRSNSEPEVAEVDTVEVLV